MGNRLFAENTTVIVYAIEEIRSFHQQYFPLARWPCIDSKSLKLLVHEKQKDYLSRYTLDFEIPLYQVSTQEELKELLQKFSLFLQSQQKAFQRIEKVSQSLCAALQTKAPLDLPLPRSLSDHWGFLYSKAQNAFFLRELYWEARRTHDLHLWMCFELEHLQSNLQILKSFVENHLEGVWRKGIIGYPGGNGILSASRDFAEIQRQIQEGMLLEEGEKLLWEGGRFSKETLPLALFQRPLLSQILKHFDQTPIETWLKDSLKEPYDLSYLNHIFWRYREENLHEEIIRLFEIYLKRPEASRQGLLEILFYRSGAVHTSHFAGDRFIPELGNFSKKLEASFSRNQAFHQAAQWTHEITRPMRYGTSNTLRYAWDEKIIDCIRSSNLCGVLLANAGVDGVYPVFTSKNGNTHALLCIHESLSFFMIDTGSGAVEGKPFPQGNSLKSSEKGKTIQMYEIYYRGLASWLNWITFLSYEPQVLSQKIPYLSEKR
jgi:hypothetical protein